MICIKDMGHEGRCRAVDGSSWENNHPATAREQAALVNADCAMRERDALAAEVAAYRRSAVVLDAVAVLVSLHLGCDEWGPSEHDAAEAAARVLAPLVGVR